MFYSKARDAAQEVAAQELYVPIFNVFTPFLVILFMYNLIVCHNLAPFLAFSTRCRFNRSWRYHKRLRLWITKDGGTSPKQKVNGGESGRYTYWDVDNWGREQKDMTVLYSDLEERNVPVFQSGSAMQAALLQAGEQAAVRNGAQGALQQQQQVQIQQQSQSAMTQRSSFQMGIAGM